jgi:predicted transcriptional regulator
MIYFACKQVNLDEIIKCSFGISKTEYNILMELTKSDGPLSVEEIVKVFKKDRTTIQKALQNLFKKKLVKRRQINLEKGGYAYYYFVEDKEEIKKKVKKIVAEWHKAVITELDEL